MLKPKSPATSTDAAAEPKGFSVGGQRLPAERLAPGLHLVSTPIGNLKDISLRALGTLAGADAVLAEDTRVTKTLLSHYGVGTPMLAYHEHNAARVRPRLIAQLVGGAAFALVSDAGTPLISDPGFKLAQEAIDAGVTVSMVPGPSAPLAALMIAGLPTDRFFFEGFLPAKSAARRARLKELENVPGALIFFESAGRVAEMIADAAAMLGPRRAAVTRELTKLHEEAIRGPLPDLAARLAAGPAPRGEIVVVVGPAETSRQTGAEAESALDDRLRAALAVASLKQAVADVAAATGLPRRVVYARALALAGKP